MRNLNKKTCMLSICITFNPHLEVGRS